MLEQYALVKAIEFVLSRPNKAFSVRGLALESGLSAGSAGDALEFMKRKGIVSFEEIGRTHQVKANLESALCRQWKVLFNLDLLAEARVVGEIKKRLKDIHAIILYGSLAKGTNDGKSDVDLLVIAHKPAKIDFGFLSRLGREANVSVLSLGDWKKKASEDRVFYEKVIYDSIVLLGERPVIL
ncbi:MAG: nucleotidyltransferase domain-containing protein [Candidatus Diapherotrites archaeon]